MKVHHNQNGWGDVLVPDSASVDPSACIHPTATVGEGTSTGEKAIVYQRAKIGAGCILMRSATVKDDAVLRNGVVLKNGAFVGCRSLIKNSSVLFNSCNVAHDCVVGEHCLIGSGTMLHLGSTLGDFVSTGRGAVIGCFSVILKHQTVLTVCGLDYQVSAYNNIRIPTMRVGCQAHTLEDWRKMDTTSISRMAGDALWFRAQHGDLILTVATMHCEAELKKITE